MSNERFAIIGAGHFGSSIATALSERGAEVLVIDSDIKVIQDLSEEVAYSVCIDATNKRALLAENIQDFDAVVVAIGEDFVKRLLCTANLLDIGVKRIICRTMGNNQRTILEKMGITEFLSPEDEVGTLFAERLLNPKTVGLTIADLNLRDAYRLSLITIRRSFSTEENGDNSTSHIIGVPENSTDIQADDCFVMFGRSQDIENFIKKNQ